MPSADPKRQDRGPFDIIGDVHGCFDELTRLLDRLGYEIAPHGPGEDLIDASHPQGRRVWFVGDITDRGPRNLDSLRLVMGMCASGHAGCVIGNHDFKLARWLAGRNVTLGHGLDITVAELTAASPALRARVLDFITELPGHVVLDGGALVIAHAGLKEELHGRHSSASRHFAMFGDTTGETDDDGLPVRRDWARHYRGKAAVVYGHTPMLETGWVNNTLCLDTACVYGGRLMALRWPEREMVSVAAARRYSEPPRPL